MRKDDGNNEDCRLGVGMRAASRDILVWELVPGRLGLMGSLG